jgi:hypothetical protein
VVAKWFYRGEAYEKEATLVRDAWVDGRAELFAPSLLLFEIGNSIRKNQNVGTRAAISLTRLAAGVAPKLVNPRRRLQDRPCGWREVRSWHSAMRSTRP